jgi:transcriptional regulator with XRE-family HTH domain
MQTPSANQPMARTVSVPYDPEIVAATAAAIRAEMARKRITVRDLATELGVSRAWVSRRTTGDMPTTPDEVQRIASALGIDAAVLLPVAS